MNTMLHSLSLVVMKNGQLRLRAAVPPPALGAVFVSRAAATKKQQQQWRRSISSTKLSIVHTAPPALAALERARPAKTQLKFGQTFAPHMLTIQFEDGAWRDPAIVPYGNLALSPAASALHYGMECFEGMKAYRALSPSGESLDDVKKGEEDLRLFRPDRNMCRLRNSMKRLGMPGTDFDSYQVIECIKELVRLDKEWIPSGRGYSLYLRPTVISTHPYLGLTIPDSLLFYVITCPVGPYYATGFNPIKLTTDTPYVRAWPGGSGSSKIGGNYGPTMMPGYEAQCRGYSQILWLYGSEEHVTEVGAMNVFFLFDKKQTTTMTNDNDDNVRRMELVTPPLTNGDILPGVTRQSILELTSRWGEFDVVERALSMKEIIDASSEGRLIEAFGAGTAAVVTPISHIQYRGVDIVIPAPGVLTQRLFNDLVDIQYGIVGGPEGWSVRV